MQSLDDFEPLEYYTKVLKGAFQKNAEEYFDALVKKSGVSPEENAKTVARYNAAAAKADAAEKKLSTGKAVRVCVILLLVAALIAGAVFLYLSVTQGTWLHILIMVLCIGLAVVLIVLLCTKIKRMIETRQKKYEAAVSKANAVKAEAYEQMRPLHELFTFNMTRELIEKTEPDIRIDDYFDVKTFDLMSRKYGLHDNADESSSTVCVLSGTVEGNPFLYERDLVCRISDTTYTGSLVIHWTTYSYDSKGNRRAVHHTQTLTATYTAPAPVYGYNTRMFYGNEAAPDLNFSRQPTHAHELSEGQVERKVRRGKKKLEKRARKALTSGTGSFTEMGNAEFDVLFGATDRDNEVQFRLMFTPLAQKNMLSLIRSDEAYGDDFAFMKRGMLNCIRSEHAQSWQIETDPSRYKSFDLAAARAEFLAFNAEYFRSVYFDLAPVLSIPLYKMQKPREFIYKDVYQRNCTSYETEAAANRFSPSLFAHQDTKTQTILKTQFVQKDGLADRVRVNAYSYDAIPRVAYIPVLGGDGYTHNVPVPWTEYIPLSRTSVMEVRPVGGTREDYERRRASEAFGNFTKRYSDTVAFGNGILAIPILQGMFDAGSDMELSSVYGVSAAGKGDVAEALAKVDKALAEAEEAEREVAAADAAEQEAAPEETAQLAEEPSAETEQAAAEDPSSEEQS